MGLSKSTNTFHYHQGEIGSLSSSLGHKAHTSRWYARGLGGVRTSGQTMDTISRWSLMSQEMYTHNQLGRLKRRDHLGDLEVDGIPYGQWRYSSIHSYLWQYVELNGQLQVPATLPWGKNPKVCWLGGWIGLDVVKIISNCCWRSNCDWTLWR
jgi:hypothetical protein